LSGVTAAHDFSETIQDGLKNAENLFLIQQFLCRADGQPNDLSRDQKCVLYYMHYGALASNFFNDWDCDAAYMPVCEVNLIGKLGFLRLQNNFRWILQIYKTLLAATQHAFLRF
jgi:hypothetical protein